MCKNIIESEIFSLPFIVVKAERDYSVLYQSSPVKDHLPKFKGLPSKILLETWLSTDRDNLDHAKRKDLIVPFTVIYAWVSVHDDWTDDPNGPFRQQKSELVRDGQVNNEFLRHITRNATFKGKTLDSVNTRLIEATCSVVDDHRKARAILSEVGRVRNDFFQTTAEIDIAGKKPTLVEILALRTGLAFKAAFLAISILEASKPEPNPKVISQISHWAAAMQVADDLIDFYDDTKENQTTLMTGALGYFGEWSSVRNWTDKFPVLPQLVLRKLAPRTATFLDDTFKSEIDCVEDESIQPFKTIASLYYHGASLVSPLKKLFRSKYQL